MSDAQKWIIRTCLVCYILCALAACWGMVAGEIGVVAVFGFMTGSFFGLGAAVVMHEEREPRQ